MTYGLDRTYRNAEQIARVGRDTQFPFAEENAESRYSRFNNYGHFKEDIPENNAPSTFDSENTIDKPLNVTNKV